MVGLEVGLLVGFRVGFRVGRGVGGRVGLTGEPVDGLSVGTRVTTVAGHGPGMQSGRPTSVHRQEPFSHEQWKRPMQLVQLLTKNVGTSCIRVTENARSLASVSD